MGVHVVSEHSHGLDDSGYSGGSMTPVEARRDAADRLVGQQALQAIHVAAITAVLILTTCGMLSDPKVGGIKSRTLDMMIPAAWVLPAVTALVVIIVCRRPVRRQVYWLRESINAAAILGILAGGIGVVSQHAPFALTVVCGVTLVCSVTTLVLHYLWRTQRVR
jgi:hypothetical protein